MSYWNDCARAAIFDPKKLAPEFPESAITDPFPFNAFYGEDEVRVIDEKSYKLELSGLIADKKPWTVAELNALPQFTQVTQHICVEGWSAIGKWGGVRFREFLARVGADTTAKYVGFKCADDYYNQYRHGDCVASTDPDIAHLPRPGAAAQVRLPDEAAHADQARLQESETYRRNFCNEYPSWWLLGRPRLQLVWRFLTFGPPQQRAASSH